MFRIDTPQGQRIRQDVPKRGRMDRLRDTNDAYLESTSTRSW